MTNYETYFITSAIYRFVMNRKFYTIWWLSFHRWIIFTCCLSKQIRDQKNCVSNNFYFYLSSSSDENGFDIFVFIFSTFSEITKKNYKNYLIFWTYYDPCQFWRKIKKWIELCFLYFNDQFLKKKKNVTNTFLCSKIPRKFV